MMFLHHLYRVLGVARSLNYGHQAIPEMRGPCVCFKILPGTVIGSKHPVASNSSAAWSMVKLRPSAKAAVRGSLW